MDFGKSKLVVVAGKMYIFYSFQETIRYERRCFYKKSENNLTMSTFILKPKESSNSMCISYVCECKGIVTNFGIVTNILINLRFIGNLYGEGFQNQVIIKLINILAQNVMLRNEMRRASLEKS